MGDAASKPRRAWVSPGFMTSPPYPARAKHRDMGVMDPETWRQLKAGVAPPKDRVPTEFVYDEAAKKAPLPDYFFRAAGLLMVNASCAEIIRPFDLGNGWLQPITLYEADKTSPIPGEYYLLVIGAQKWAFLIDEPHKAEATMMRKFWRLYTDEIASDEIVCSLSPLALDGADIWCDPQVLGNVFLSDRLALALRSAGLDELFVLRECRIL